MYPAGGGAGSPPSATLERDMEQLEQISRTLVPLPPRVLCEKCIHAASVILDNRPLCGDCFLIESRHVEDRQSCLSVHV